MGMSSKRNTKQVELPWTTVLSTYLSYILVLLLAYFHEYFLQFFYVIDSCAPQGYAPLIDRFTLFYSRYLYGRISDCWNRPIKSDPGPWIDVIERQPVGGHRFGEFNLTNTTKKCLNLGSYNYLGFAETSGKCIDQVSASLKNYSSSLSTSRINMGTTPVHQELERLVAKFVGKEDSITFGMGYATNSTNLASIAGKGCLLLSDSLNHASLVVGMRCSEAKLKVFKHNDPVSCEKILRESIIEGQPRTRRPWKKIIIVVEGVYSMEGAILRLPEFVALKKKYKAYLYVDEAHSIGALGRRGRGVCDHWGVDPKDVDILMGTFTKSFGSAGGYISGSKKLIDQLRSSSFGFIYDTAMSIPVAQQIIASMKIIMGEDGSDEGRRRLDMLRENSNYFRKRLTEIGFDVISDQDSPIIPIMITHPHKMPYFSRECLEQNIGVVIAGYPATPILASRARFCISSSHTKEELENSIQIMEQIAKRCLLI